MPPESRSLKRKERYRELRALGFSAKEARKYRDQSGIHIEQKISSERRRISSKPQQLRSSEESFKLKRIQDRAKSVGNIYRQSRVSSRRERWIRFSKWSQTNKFPKQFLKRIEEINRRAGIQRGDENEGYGYRRFYYEYVERLSMEDSIQFSERADSGVRYLRNKPLVPGRENLRASLSIAKQSKAS